MDSLQRKGINFDLNTQALKEYYPKGDWHNAYADVRDFFEANGFEHIHEIMAILDKYMQKPVVALNPKKIVGSYLSDDKRISMAQLLCECVYHIRCTGTV